MSEEIGIDSNDRAEDGSPENNENQSRRENDDKPSSETTEKSGTNNEEDQSAKNEEELSPEELMEKYREERDEYKEKYLRKSADLKNLRERKKREKEDYMKYANKSLLEDLLEVIDNFERALESENTEDEDFQDGVEMIHQQLRDLLNKYNVDKIDAEGEKFDPHRHEGMMREERSDIEDQIIIEVFSEGYMLHDRVLRPAKVKVGVPSSSESEDHNTEE